MINLRIIAIVTLGCCLLSCQEEPEATEPRVIEATQAELTELEGTWEVVSVVLDGHQVEYDDFFWRFEGNITYYRVPDDKAWRKGATFSVNPAAMPAEIDWIDSHAIYEIDGDLLKICKGGPRPGRFEASGDYPTELWLFRRVTEEESE